MELMHINANKHANWFKLYGLYFCFRLDMT